MSELHQQDVAKLNQLASEFRHTSWAMKVQEFNAQNGYWAPAMPQHPHEHIKMLRMRLMVEELAELTIAMHENNIVEVADGLTDLLYVVVGTAVDYGLGPILDKLFDEVHRSNMTKFRGDFTNPERLTPGSVVNDKYSGKVRKSGDYEPAQVERIIEEHWKSYREKVEHGHGSPTQNPR